MKTQPPLSHNHVIVVALLCAAALGLAALTINSNNPTRLHVRGSGAEFTAESIPKGAT